jgi:hypothetical protein
MSIINAGRIRIGGFFKTNALRLSDRINDGRSVLQAKAWLARNYGSGMNFKMLADKIFDTCVTNEYAIRWEVANVYKKKFTAFPLARNEKLTTSIQLIELINELKDDSEQIKCAGTVAELIKFFELS